MLSFIGVCVKNIRAACGENKIVSFIFTDVPIGDIFYEVIKWQYIF